MSHELRPVIFSLALGMQGAALANDSPSAPPTSPATDAPRELPAVVVSSSALALTEQSMGTPLTVLTGDELVRKRAATLGETLAGEPGMTSTHYGAAASRPVIRGMDGARVRILSDGAEIMDASTVSPDHAVSLEPMLTRQIEVLRGPSALAYGGGATGGVVNVLDRRIPTEIPLQGLEGSVELRAASAAREGAGAFELTLGQGNFALHAEGLKRDSSDYRVGDGWADGKRVDNSFNDLNTGSFGLSWIDDRGYLGIAHTRLRNDYGLPGHGHGLEECAAESNTLHCGHAEDTAAASEAEHGDPGGHQAYVRLDSRRWDLRGEYRMPFSGFETIRLRASQTDYTHDEIEDGRVGTRFRNDAHDVRIELEHQPLGAWRGVIGLQTGERDFKASGEEAYLPPTLTRKQGAYLIEEYRQATWRLEAAWRREWQDIAVDSTRAPDTRHDGNSASLGVVFNLAPQYSLGLTLARSQRLPSAEELYADGPHAATMTIERGNPLLKPETAHNIDLTLKKLAGDTTFSLSAFRNRIDDYIYAHTLAAEAGVQLVEYAQRDATFRGLEAQVSQRLNPMFSVTLFGDAVRARFDQAAGERDLPRIPAHRLGLRLDTRWQRWLGQIEFYRVDRQDQIAGFETSTAGYDMLNIGLAYHGRHGAQPYQFYLKANNLGDALAYSHTSFIKTQAPLMGRNLTTGLNLAF